MVREAARDAPYLPRTHPDPKQLALDFFNDLGRELRRFGDLVFGKETTACAGPPDRRDSSPAPSRREQARKQGLERVTRFERATSTLGTKVSAFVFRMALGGR